MQLQTLEFVSFNETQDSPVPTQKGAITEVVGGQKRLLTMAIHKPGEMPHTQTMQAMGVRQMPAPQVNQVVPLSQIQSLMGLNNNFVLSRGTQCL